MTEELERDREPEWFADWKQARLDVYGQGLGFIAWENLNSQSRQMVENFVARLRKRLEHEIRGEIQARVVKEYFRAEVEARAAGATPAGAPGPQFDCPVFDPEAQTRRELTAEGPEAVSK